YPDLSAFKATGGKVIHIYGKSDDSIPAGLLVYCYDSMHSVMFPDKSYNK
ncbi:uncharacterized protein BKA55DRAFT_717522, partial [Fusarium redolens]